MAGKENLETSIGQLSALLTQTLMTQEDERRSITHTLQEEIGQQLAAISVNLRVLQSRCEEVQSVSIIDKTRILVTDVLQHIERLERQLYPPALDSQGLIPALEVFIQDFVRQSQIYVELDAEVLDSRLPAEIELTLFRITQEVLEHTRHHGCASDVRVMLRLIPSFIYLGIEDRGIHYTSEILAGAVFSRLKHRAGAVGGKCEVFSTPEHGARVEVVLPQESEGVR